jgi:hypothetical protein
VLAVEQPPNPSVDRRRQDVLAELVQRGDQTAVRIVMMAEGLLDTGALRDEPHASRDRTLGNQVDGAQQGRVHCGRRRRGGGRRLVRAVAALTGGGSTAVERVDTTADQRSAECPIRSGRPPTPSGRSRRRAKRWFPDRSPESRIPTTARTTRIPTRTPSGATSKKSTDADSGSDSKKEKSTSQSRKSSDPEPESGSTLAAVDNIVASVAKPVAKIGDAITALGHN